MRGRVIHQRSPQVARDAEPPYDCYREPSILSAGGECIGGLFSPWQWAGRRLRQIQWSCAEHFVFAEGFEGGGGNSNDGNGIADGVEDFDEKYPSVLSGAT